MSTEKPFSLYLLPARNLSKWPQILTVVAAISAVALLVLIVMSRVEESREAELQSAILSNQDRVTVFASFVSRSLDYLERTTDDFSTGSEIDDGMSQLNKFADEGIWGFLVTDRSSRVVFSTLDFDSATAENVSAYIREQNGNGFLSPPFEAANGQQVLVFGRGNGAANSGKATYILVAPSFFLSFADQINFADGDLISLIGLDGITRARKTGDRISSGEDLSGKLVMERQLADPNVTYSGPNALTGDLSVFSHRRIADYGVFATSGLTIDRVKIAASDRARFLWLMLTLAASIVGIATLAVLRSFRKQHAQLRLLERNITRLRASQIMGGIGDWDYDIENKTFEVSEVLRDVYGFPTRANFTIKDFAEKLGERCTRDLHFTMNDVQVFRDPRCVEVNFEDAGQNVYREITIGPILSSDGELIGLHALDRDISRDKRIGALRARLAIMSRLDAMSALAATIAHEISQPLSAAKSLITASKRALSQNDLAKADELIERSHEQMRFVSDIILNARRELQSWGGADQYFEITEAVRATEELLKNFYEDRQFEIIFHADNDARFARGTLSQAKQIFFNLFKNSIEATPDGRRSQIEVMAQSVAGGMVKLTLCDNGKGFSSETDPFELFTSSKEGGLGVGMALTKTVVEALGGDIWIEESERTGATICVTFDASAVQDELVRRKAS